MESADRAALLLLNLPEAALTGIDLLSFTTTPRFKGVKNIPPGLHFVFVGTSTAFSERHGLFFEVPSPGAPPLVVAKWDAASESLAFEEDEAEILRLRANLGTIWQEWLTPYRQMANANDEGETEEGSGEWSTLTSFITKQSLTRIMGGNSKNWGLSSASSSKRDLEDIPGLNAEDLKLKTGQERDQTNTSRDQLWAVQELYFAPIDLKQTWREGAVGRERTEAARDRSWAVQDLVSDPSNTT
jgi:A1 cistron-splicing factor AAR2